MYIDNLRNIINEKNISLIELSNKSRVSRTSIYRILNKKTETNISTMQKITDALDIELKDIL